MCAGAFVGRLEREGVRERGSEGERGGKREEGERGGEGGRDKGQAVR